MMSEHAWNSIESLTQQKLTENKTSGNKKEIIEIK